MRPLRLSPDERPTLPTQRSGRLAPPAAKARPRRSGPRWRFSRQFRLAGYGAAVLALAGSLFWLLREQHLGRIWDGAGEAIAESMAASGLVVAEINVTGRHETPPEDLLRAIGLRRGDPIMFFDANVARQRIEQIPWVAQATVQRILPATILVHIVERRPFARWQIDGRTLLVDREGKTLLGGNPEEFRDLRRVVGPGAGLRAKALFDMLALEPELEKRVRDAVRVRERRWDIEFDNGVVVQLPEEAPETAWRHLALLDREKKLLDRAVSVIDLRLADRMVVRLTPEAQQVVNPPPAPKKAGAKNT